MLVFAAKRALWAVSVVFMVVTMVLVLLFGIGDPCVAKLGANARPVQLEACRAQYGFDQSLRAQYLSYLGLGPCVRTNSAAYRQNGESGHCGLLQGDLGESMSHGEPVTNVILTRLPRTLLLGAVAILIELLLGLVIGIVAAVRRNTWLDTGIMTAAFLGISAPTFLTGLLFLNWLAFRLGWFPVGGYGEGFADHVYHALLPGFTLAIIGAATYARIMRSEMIETLSSDFVRTARAKGAGPLSVILRHGARNALLPIVTLLGLSLAILVSGAVITETIYAWPGIGKLAIESIYNLDAFTVVGVVLMASLAVQTGNLLADIAVALLDPRVRLERS